MATAQSILEYYNERPYSSYSQKAYDILQEMFVTLVLQPGRVYSELELSSMLGIGRTPVREAVKRLETIMLLETVPRSGVRVSDIRLEDFYLQMEVRKVLEKLIILRAVKFSIPPERKRLLEMADEWDRVGEEHDSLKAVRIDNEFHRLIIECARNPFAKRAIAPFHLQERRLFYIEYYTEPERTYEINRTHSELMRAIARRDLERASQAFDKMMTSVEDLGKLRLKVW